MNKDRVKFYSQNDLCYGINLDKIESINPIYEEISINDAIEFYEIYRYFEDGARKKTWSDSDYTNYRAKSKQLLGLSKRFINQINDENIVSIYNEVELQYQSVFWFLFQNCKLQNKISSKSFDALICGCRISPNDLFRHKDIVHKYAHNLKRYILKDNRCVPICLHVYEQDYTEDEKLILPSTLSGEDICNYLEAYIDSKQANPNYLEIIMNMHCSPQFPITDEIRLKAKRRYQKELEIISKTSPSIHHNFQISIEQNQKDIKVESCNNNHFTISYGENWLLETLDYPSILNNFIYVFNFVDYSQIRFMHVNKTSQSGVVELFHRLKSSRIYPKNHAFDFTQTIALLQMNAYYDFLLSQNIQLEDVLKWFFTEQIQEEYGCSPMRVSMPSPSGSYAEKCSTILTAFESILKQYYFYVRNGEIDFELVSMSSTPIEIKNIKSLVPNKYIYGHDKEYKTLSFWLFSNQCTFSYIKRIDDTGKHYERLIDLLLNEDVYLSDYQNEEHSSFKIMANHDLINIHENGKITLTNLFKLRILQDLYENDVISRWHLSRSFEDAIADFSKKGIIETQSTLFSQPEIDYFSFLLNRAEYCNGLEIRNRYMHGIQQVNTNEAEHKQNYFILLRLFVLLAIKINDDLYLREQIEKKENNSL